MLGNQLAIGETGLDSLHHIGDELGQILTIGQVDQTRQLRAPPVVSTKCGGGGVGDAAVVWVQTTQFGLGWVRRRFSLKLIIILHSHYYQILP